MPFAITGELPGEYWLQAYGTSSLVFGAVGSVLLMSDILLPVPSSIIGTLLGARLGAAAGFAWTFAGLMAGNLVGYAAGRLVLPSIEENVQKAPGALLLFLSRPVPVLAESLCLAAGAGRLRFTTVLAACAAGNAMYAAMLVGAGAALLPQGFTMGWLAVAMLLPAAAWLAWQRFAPSS
ncbi:MAG: hypothetical protein AAFN78_13860 [Pseudomonadota bacterium]